MTARVIIHMTAYEQRLELGTIVGDLSSFERISIIIVNKNKFSWRGTQYMKQSIIQTPTNYEMFVRRKRQRETMQ